MALVIGIGVGLLIALLLKRQPGMRRSPTHQTSVLFLGAYVSFCLSDAFAYSGVLTVFFCGLTMSHYAWHSLSESAQKSTKTTFATMSQIAEAYCFAAVGISLHKFQNPKQVSWPLAGLTLLTLLTGRALTIFGICGVGNRLFRKSFNMSMKEQYVLYAGGLIRGAVCWAQAIQVRDPHRHVMLSTTLTTILFTVLVIGSLLPKFLQIMNLDDKKWHVENPLRKTLSSPNLAMFQSRDGGVGRDAEEVGLLQSAEPKTPQGQEARSHGITPKGSIMKNFDNIIMKWVGARAFAITLHGARCSFVSNAVLPSFNLLLFSDQYLEERSFHFLQLRLPYVWLSRKPKKQAFLSRAEATAHWKARRLMAR